MRGGLMSKPMTHLDMSLTHLQAFMSEDGRRGRVWTDDQYHYRRYGDGMERKSIISLDRWFGVTQQVAAMAGNVTWAYADEPKTLTPQEALRALADGKVLRDKDLLWKLGGDGCIYTKYGSAPWEECPSLSFNDWVIVPDPSQPAEKVTYAEALSSAMDMPSYVKAELQVGYPLTFDEAWPECARKRAFIECERTPGVLFGLNENNCRYRMEPNKGFRSGWQLDRSELEAKWRIVEAK